VLNTQPVDSTSDGCDDNVFLNGPEAGNDFEDSIMAGLTSQNKGIHATTPEQSESGLKKQRSLTAEVVISLQCGHGLQKIMTLKRPSLQPAKIAKLLPIITRNSKMQKSMYLF
jgi:hypothetical protein